MSMQKFFTKISAIIILISFIAMTIFMSLYKNKKDISEKLVADITIVHDALQKIHHDCTIIDFDYQKNYINFLNIASFVGSEVGSINLMYPENWHGPYVDDNPTFQEIEYQVIKTIHGYFIVPGNGVTLPNDKVVGEDFLLEKETDIISLSANENGLRYKTYLFAKKLNLEKKIDKRLEVIVNI